MKTDNATESHSSLNTNLIYYKEKTLNGTWLYTKEDDYLHHAILMKSYSQTLFIQMAAKVNKQNKQTNSLFNSNGAQSFNSKIRRLFKESRIQYLYNTKQYSVGHLPWHKAAVSSTRPPRGSNAACKHLKIMELFKNL